jgi:ATP-dependent Lon protease
LILPDGNRGDFEELPEQIRAGLQVDFVSKYRQVANIILKQ